MSVTPPISSLPSGYQTPTDQPTHTFTHQQLYQGLLNVPAAEEKERKEKNAPMPGGRRKKHRKYRRKRKSRKSRRKRKSRKSRKKRRKTRRRYRRGGTRKYSDGDIMKATMSLRKMNPLTKKAYLYKNKYIGGPLHDSIIEAQQKKKYKQAAAKAMEHSKAIENQQAGRRTRRKRKRRTRRKLQHGGAGGVEMENWRPNNTYGFIKAADFSSKIPVDSHPSYTANPSMNF